MTFRPAKPLFLIALALPMATAHAQNGGNEHDAMLYLESLAMPKRATVCANRLAGYAHKFDPKFAAWRNANQARLVAGEATLRAQQDFANQVQSVTLVATQNLERATPELLKEDCNAMLDELTVASRDTR
ncbi:MAG: hypothetical protein KF892_11115 [Rhizobacter sp.]|nr:hypothetical protein [Rhizobacter sp.]